MGRIICRDIQKTVNIEKLTDELRAVLGEMVLRVSPENGSTRICLDSPTLEEIDTAIQIVQAHNPVDLTTAQQTLEAIKNLIQGAVGKSVTELTTAERWALLAGLLYQNKAIAPDMTIRPPAQWIGRQDHFD